MWSTNIPRCNIYVQKRDLVKEIDKLMTLAEWSKNAIKNEATCEVQLLCSTVTVTDNTLFKGSKKIDF